MIDPILLNGRVTRPLMTEAEAREKKRQREAEREAIMSVRSAPGGDEHEISIPARSV